MVDSKPTEVRVVFLPIDGSHHSERAFDWYLEHVKRDTDKLWFVNVVEPMYGVPGPVIIADLPHVLEMEANRAKKLCQQYVDKAKENKLEAHATVQVEQKSGPALVNLIAEYNASLVVMGSRGLGTIRRTFLGSTSDYLLHHAHIATIIVPPPA